MIHFPSSKVFGAATLAGLSAVLFLVSTLGAASFRITSIQLTNNDVRITWNAPGGSNYAVQAVTPLRTNFVNLNASNFVPHGTDQVLSFTDPGARTSAASRFYRVRAFPPPRLEIEPTNAMIDVGMTNRYKVLFFNPDNVASDVTASAFLSVTSLTTSIAQFVRITTNGFAAVRGISRGIATIRAVYQGVTNTVSLMVSNMNGGMYTVPASFSGNVEGPPSTGRVFGVFGGKTVNITPAADLGGNAALVTRVNYSVAADVANSFALVTGQSAADDSIRFTAGTNQTPQIDVNWCDFVDVTLEPRFINISVGQTQELAVIGRRANGETASALNQVDDIFFDTSLARVEEGFNYLRVVGLAPGSSGFNVYVDNLVNCGTFSVFGYLTVTAPPTITNQLGDQLIAIGSDATFRIQAGGSLPLSYQWQFNGTNLPGAVSNSVRVSNVTSAHQGDYRVIVTNDYGSVTSSVATLTVAAAAVPLWTNRYDGPASLGDEAYAIAVDGSGNVIVTGSSRGSGSGGSYDYATIKYSGAGLPLWTNRYNGPGNNDDTGEAIAVDASNNVFVTGYSVGSSGNYDYATIKYSPTGARLWTNRYNGPANGYDIATAITATRSGDVFVTGYASASGAASDYATIRYSGAGVPLLTNRYNGPGSGDDVGAAIAVDVNSNILVTGSSLGSDGSYDYATIKYSPVGGPLWTNRYNGSGNSDDFAGAVTTDGGGNVFITGYSMGSGGNHDYATIKYSPAGLPLWTNRYDGPGNGDDIVHTIGVDGAGNVFVAGHSRGSGGNYDYATIKYSGSGTPLWTNRYNGPENGDDFPQTVAVDAGGDVCVTGYSFDAGNFAAFATIKYSNSGAIQWISRPAGGYARDLAVDSAGNVFVTGSVPDGSGYSEYVTIKYCSGSSPPNDPFSNRFLLHGDLVVTNGNNDCASKEPGEPGHGGNAGGKSIWWSWTAPSNGVATINTCGSSFDTLLAVYAGTSVSALSLIASNDDYCGPDLLQSQVRFQASAGTTYQIAVDGYKYPGDLSARSGDITLTVSTVPLAFAQWNFNSVLADTNSTTGTLNPSLGSGAASYVGGVSAAGTGEFAGGSSNDGNTTDNSAWNTSNYPLPGAGNKTAGVQFNVSTLGTERIVITWDQRVSNTGSKYVRLQYSTNGTSFVDYPAATSISSAVVFESTTNSLETFPGVNNNPNFAFRIVSEFESTAVGNSNAVYVGASGAYGSGGTIRFDRVTISGVPTAPP